MNSANPITRTPMYPIPSLFIDEISPLNLDVPINSSSSSINHPNNASTSTTTVEIFRTPSVTLSISDQTEEPAQLPSLAELIKKFKSRPRTSDAIAYSKKEHDEDGIILLSIVSKYNEMFTNHTKNGPKESIGFEKGLDLNTDDALYVRADLHTDCGTFMGELDLFQKDGLITSDYRCAPGFNAMFLGDFSNRGDNGIETLSLIYLFAIENPHSVHLVRGNHEDITLQTASIFCNSTSELIEALWFDAHSALFTPCYQRLPLGICVGDKTPTKKGLRKFIYCTHGAFQTAQDLSPIISGKASTIPVIPFPTPLKPEKKENETRWEVKQRTGREILLPVTQAIGDQQQFLHQWGEIRAERRFLTERGRGWSLTALDLYHYFQATGSANGRIVMILTGHKHVKEEYFITTSSHKERVIATSLPAGIMLGELKNIPSIGSQKIQGLLFKVAPSVKDWTKRPVFFENGSFRLSETAVPMYEPLP